MNLDPEAPCDGGSAETETLESTLLRTTHSRIEKKDFSKEIRVMMDVEEFVYSGHVVIKDHFTTSNEINQDVIQETLYLKGNCSIEEIKQCLFIGTTNLLAQTIQSSSVKNPGHLRWLIGYGSSASIERRYLQMIANFEVELNYLGHPIDLFMLIITPESDKETKSPFEFARTFATLFDSLMIRDFSSYLWHNAKPETLFRANLMIKAKELSKLNFKNRHKYAFSPMISVIIDKRDGNSRVKENYIQSIETNRVSVALTQSYNTKELPSSIEHKFQDTKIKDNWFNHKFGKGVFEDLKNRLASYPNDYKDAFVGPERTIQKTIATTWWLYFGILLPIIAFNLLNHIQTNGSMGNLKKSILAQALGGLIFALIGGQPLVIIMTTAPLCLYTKIIYSMSQDYNFDFSSMYAAVGIWNGIFLSIYSLFNFSYLMKWCTRSTEEIFSMFIVVAFITYAFKDMMKNFNKFYFTEACTDQLESKGFCRRDSSILFLLLMLATLWLAMTLYRFHKTPYLAVTIRIFLSEYALPIAVVVISFLGSYIFDKVYVEESPTSDLGLEFSAANLAQLSPIGHLLSMVLGFTLSVLFFMDQNISAAMVQSPRNNLKKSSAYHYDLLVVGFLNVLLTLFGLPMMHGVLPHSPLHVRNLADFKETIHNGHKVERITYVRETRVTALAAHLLILASLYMVPYPIEYIPRAVLNGLFLYMAMTSLDGLGLFDRILLLFTQQDKYPPSDYVRSCPQRIIHLFTLSQIFQLFIMCLFGFSPINGIEMFFPVIILLIVLFRHKIIPKVIPQRYLDILD